MRYILLFAHFCNINNIVDYQFQNEIERSEKMDKSLEFKKFREEYKEFYFNNYSIREDEAAIYLEYEFEIPNLTKFNPTTKILKKSMSFKDINSDCVKNMVFHIGLIELVSYWKCTCTPKIIIKCGHLNDEQISWWKKIYFYGLG